MKSSSLDVIAGALPALVDKIPVVGPIIAALFGAGDVIGRHKIFEKRLSSFLEDLRDEFSNPLRDTYPKQYLESQDYAHLILLAFEHALRTRQETKRRLYARALKNAASPRWGAERCDLAEELLNVLAELSPIKIRVLQAAWMVFSSQRQPAELLETELQRILVSVSDIAPHVEDVGLSELMIQAYVGKLRRFGFTEERLGAILDYSGGQYHLTPLVVELMELVKADQ